MIGSTNTVSLAAAALSSQEHGGLDGADFLVDVLAWFEARVAGDRALGGEGPLVADLG